MVWKKKLRSPQYTFNSEKVFWLPHNPVSQSIHTYRQQSFD